MVCRLFRLGFFSGDSGSLLRLFCDGSSTIGRFDVPAFSRDLISAVRGYRIPSGLVFFLAILVVSSAFLRWIVHDRSVWRLRVQPGLGFGPSRVFRFVVWQFWSFFAPFLRWVVRDRPIWRPRVQPRLDFGRSRVSGLFSFSGNSGQSYFLLCCDGSSTIGRFGVPAFSRGLISSVRGCLVWEKWDISGFFKIRCDFVSVKSVNFILKTGCQKRQKKGRLSMKCGGLIPKSAVSDWGQGKTG